MYFIQKKWLITLISLSIFVLLFSACGQADHTPSASAPSDTQPAPSPSQTTDQDKQKGEGEEVAAAQADGKLLIYSAGPKGLAEKVLEGFTAATGIEAEMFQGTTGAILGRLEAEANNPQADVIVLASWPAAMDLKSRDLLLPYPEAALADRLHQNWNADGYFFGYSASALGITYNTQLVTEPGQDWIDYTTEEWKGEVNIPDPSLSGSALDFVAGYISNYPEHGWELFEGLKQNQVLVAGANNEALDPVILGAKRAVLAGVDYMAYSAKAKGEPIDILYPTSGTVVNPRPAMILKSTTQEENAKRFIDYLLSDEVQQMVADAFLIPGRSDFPAHPERVGMEDIPQFEIDWQWMSEQQEEINAQFQSIMR